MGILVRIRKFSHHFEVSEIASTDKDICVRFAMQFIEYERQSGNITGQPTMTRIYAASNASRSEFRFHINTYDSFISLYRMTDHTLARLTVEEIPLYKPAVAEFNFDPNASPRPIQVPLIGFVLDGTGTAKLIELQTGMGKAQPLYSKIKVPGGWSTMGQMQVGTVVSTPDGGTGNVIGIYPQGMKDIYEIQLVDSCSAQGCLEHLWPIWIDDSVTSVIRSTAEIIELLEEHTVSLAVDGGTPEFSYRQPINTIELVGQYEAQCIMIDHPDHLYITDDYIVTHNTFLALWCAAQLKVRTVIVLKGGYVERWIPDLVSIRGKPSLLGLQPDQIRIVRGLADMAQLCFDAMQGNITESVIVFSTDTLRMYQDHYEGLNGEMSLFANIPPQYLWEAIGAGFKITDEIHQLFHANFKQDLYSHIPLTLSLSATMVAGDPFKKMLYDTMFPKSTKTDNGEYKRYVDVHTLLYRLDYKSQITIRWNVRGRKDYSQIEFEKSILKNKRVKENYLNMICDRVTRLFVKRRQTGQKLLVFCGSVDMCNVVVGELRKRHSSLAINKYTSEDPYKHITESEIIVSTVGSLGTAHDIADLWQVHLTVGLGKEDTNLQVLGRLREMKNYPGCTPEMYYYACEDIDKQMRYHTTKQELFKTRVLKHCIENTGLAL